MKNLKTTLKNKIIRYKTKIKNLLLGDVINKRFIYKLDIGKLGEHY